MAEDPGLIVGYAQIDEDAEGRRGLRPFATIKALPTELGVTIGDVVHCLHSALDHLVWKVAKKPANNTVFPIEDKTPNIDKNKHPALPGVGGGASKEVRAVLAQFQPWYPDGVIRWDHPLRLLKEMSNHDKHRQLSIPAPDIGFDPVDGVSQLPLGTKLVPWPMGPNIEEGSAQFMFVPVGAAHGDVKVDVRFTWRLCGLVTSLENPNAPPINVVVLPFLRGTLNMVRDDILPALKPHLLR